MEDQDDDAKHDEDETPDEELLEDARRDWTEAVEAWGDQKKREVDDLRFQVPEMQWDEDAKRARQGFGTPGVPLPARPILSISRLDQPIQMVLNQERGAHLGVSIHPLSADANSDTATILEGLYRRIERDSHAEVARSWSFSRAVQCGMGFYRVVTEYDDCDPQYPDDQVIRIKRILHQSSVYLDPKAEQPDFSDGRYAFVCSWIPLSQLKKRYPGMKTDVNREEFFSDMQQDYPAWVDQDGEQKGILVAEYWQRQVSYSRPKKGQRQKEDVKVRWSLVTGFEVLETQEWNGKYIPIIPHIGKELHPFDTERRWIGITTNAKDGQRLYNYAASSAVERVALEPKAPFIGAEGQFEGHESEWRDANTRNFPYLQYKPVTLNGAAMPAPQRAQVDASGLSVSMQLLQQADQFIQATTATYDPALGRTSSREKSGKAIMALQQQGDEGNSHFMHNAADISMSYEARVILDLMPAIYDRPGRIARTLDEEDRSETIMLNAPFSQHPETKMPMPAPPQRQAGPQGAPMPPPGLMGQSMPPGGPGGPGMPPQGPQGMPPGLPPLPAKPPEVKHYDLRKGIYSVAVSIGKTRQSALQEGAEEIGQILQSNPQLMPIIGPLYFKYRDFPGAKEIGKLMQEIRDKQFPGLGKEGDQPDAAQAQAQVQQLQQQLQQMQQMLQAATEQIKLKTTEQQGVLMKAQMDNQTKLQTAQLDSQTKLAVAQGQNDTKLTLESLAGKVKQLEQLMQMGHEHSLQASDQQHEAAMAVAQPALGGMPEWKAANPTPLDEPQDQTVQTTLGGA